jgi:hypothetical protein
MSITIERVEGSRGMRDWLQVPRRVYADDPDWVQLPAFLERRRVSRKHAPFFKFGDAELFLARRDGVAIGRISAQVNHRHVELHRDGTGHFGFFDCLDDAAAAQALVDAASSWLLERGLARMVGPLSFSMNEEVGCLIEGFEGPPAVLMPHHRPWTGPLLEAAGLRKEMDLFAYRVEKFRAPERVTRIAAAYSRGSHTAMRPADMRRLAQEVRLAFDICADAWGSNWGFVPFDEAEVESLVHELRPVIRPDFLQFLTIDGREAGIILVLPNANEVIAAQRPSGIALLDLLRTYLTLRLKGTRTFRFALMGIRREYQSSPASGPLLALLFRELVALQEKYRPQWTEMSWILETNRPMVRMAEMLAGPPSKTYRLYSRAL